MSSKLFTFFLVTVLMTSAFGHAQTTAKKCSALVNRQMPLDSLFETRATFDANWKEWLRGRVDIAEANISKFRMEDRSLSRWQYMNRRMSPAVRLILMRARPEFFQDQILPSPLEITQAMKSLYVEKGIPKELWILPGMILVSKTNKRSFRAFTYEALQHSWPKDFELPSKVQPSELEINQAFRDGVAVFEYKTHLQFNSQMHMTYHDLHHLGSFLDRDYVQAFRYFYNQVADKSKASKHVREVEVEYYGDLGAYHFIEEFWRVEPSKIPLVNRLLSVMKTTNGKPLYSAESNNLNEIKNNLTLNMETFFPEYQQLKERKEALVEKIKRANLNLYKLDNWPSQLLVERQQILNDLKPMMDKLNAMANEIERIYEDEITRIGGSIADQITVRMLHYADSDYKVPLARLKAIIGRQAEVLLEIDRNELDVSLNLLVFPLVKGTQMRGEKLKEELDRIANSSIRKFN